MTTGWHAKGDYPSGIAMSTFQTAHYLDEDGTPACTNAGPKIRFTCTWKPAWEGVHLCTTCRRLRDPARRCECAECLLRTSGLDAKQLAKVVWMLEEMRCKLRAQRAPADIRDKLLDLAEAVDRLLDTCHTRRP